MTKAERIMKLYEQGGLTVQEIAQRIGCLDSYVRVVARQRKGTGMSAADKRYRAKVNANGDHALAIRNARKAYRAARRMGQGKRGADIARVTAYARTMRRTYVKAQAHA
jgi:transposase-like protein